MNLQCKFIGISMESTWTSAWNVHGMGHSIWNLYGLQSGYGMKKWLGCQPKNCPYGVHGMALDSTHSIWIPYGKYQGV